MNDPFLPTPSRTLPNIFRPSTKGAGARVCGRVGKVNSEVTCGRCQGLSRWLQSFFGISGCGVANETVS